MRIENGVLVIRPADASMKISDVAEKIISGIMDSNELDIIGISSGIYLAFASIHMARSIANIHIDELCIDYIDIPILGKIEAISCRLSKKEGVDSKKMVVEEEKDMNLTPDRDGQVISVGHGITMEKLITLSLIKFARFKKLKLIAAGSSITESVSLALKLTKGQISKDTVCVDLIDIYSIASRNDPAKQITATSIYLKKGLPTQYSKRHIELIKKLKI